MLVVIFFGAAVLILLLTEHAPTASASAEGASNRAAPSIDRLLDASPLKLPLVNPKIVITKHRRILELYSNDEVVRTYSVGLGFTPAGDKVRQGDGRTPEGEFYICVKNAKSKYYLSLGLSYPNEEAAKRGLRAGLITPAEHDRIASAIRRRAVPPQRTALGGEIYIHGNGSKSDWTWGCVALDDADIRELFDAVPVRTAVTIYP